MGDSIELKRNDCDDGYEVLDARGGRLGYVYPDAFEGWRCFSIYGRQLSPGSPALRAIWPAAYWFRRAAQARDPRPGGLIG